MNIVFFMIFFLYVVPAQVLSGPVFKSNSTSQSNYFSEPAAQAQQIKQPLSSYISSIYDSAVKVASKFSEALKTATSTAKTTIINGSNNVKQGVVDSSNALYDKFKSPQKNVMQKNDQGINLGYIELPNDVATPRLGRSIGLGIIENRDVYERSLSLKNEEYQKATPQNLVSSIISLPIGSAKQIVIDPARPSDYKSNIAGLAVAVDATGQFITKKGQGCYATLVDSVGAIAKYALNNTYQKNVNQEIAISALKKQRDSLAKDYKNALDLLESSATSQQIKQVNLEINQKLKDKTVQELFLSSGVKVSYSAFMKEVSNLGDNPTQVELIQLLEKHIQLPQGGFATIAGKIKLESFYRQLDLIRLKQESSFNFMSNKTTNNQINQIMQAVRSVEPFVKTDTQLLLLRKSTDKQAILLVTEIDFVDVTLGRLIKDLSSIDRL